MNTQGKRQTFAYFHNSFGLLVRKKVCTYVTAILVSTYVHSVFKKCYNKDKHGSTQLLDTLHPLLHQF